MTTAVSELVERALHVPAHGDEAVDWRARNLAELLLHARVAADDALVAAVDHAAGMLPPVFPRFGDRLGDLRRCFGPVPDTYPGNRSTPPVPSPWPRSAVRRRAAQLARLSDACLARTTADEPYAPSNAQESAADLDRLAEARVLGRTAHRCVDVDIDSRLVWREWLMDGGVPTLAVSPRDPDRPASEVRPGMQLHMGAHLDHLAELADSRGPEDAARLQFGTGLLVAESVAMAGELIALAGGVPLGPIHLSSLCLLAADRLSRLPGISEWGEALLPSSPTMAAAVRATNKEFAVLPVLAETYVSGPFALAERDFTHPLIPPRLRRSLSTKWRAAIGGRRPR